MNLLVAMLFFLLMTLISFAGVRATIGVRAGWPWWLPVITGMASYACWSLVTKFTTTNLVVLSAWSDVVVALAWFAGFWWLGGETISRVQWTGIALLVTGLGLVNWR